MGRLRNTLAAQIYGKVVYQGAWSSFRPKHGPFDVPKLAEGNPTTKVSEEDAAHFLIRMVHKFPHQITIYAAGPMTNVAQAISLDPHCNLTRDMVELPLRFEAQP